MMATIRSIIAVAATCLLLASCHRGPTFDFTGVWLGHRHVAPKPGVSGAALAEVSRLKLWINPDGTFKMENAGIQITGSVDFRGQEVVLSPETEFGQKIDRLPDSVQKALVPMTVVPSGKDQIFLKADMFDPTGMHLKKFKP